MIFQFILWHLVRTIDDQCTTIGMDSFTDCLNQQHSNLVTSRRRNTKSSSGSRNSGVYTASQQAINQAAALSQWKRIMLLVSMHFDLLLTQSQILNVRISIFRNR